MTREETIGRIVVMIALFPAVYLWLGIDMGAIMALGYVWPTVPMFVCTSIAFVLPAVLHTYLADYIYETYFAKRQGHDS